MNTGVANIEEALSLTGYGKFHYLLSACCALCLLASGIQNGLNAYILPVAQCDLNLTSAQLGSLNASVLIGGICSSFLWGLLADLIGRRKVLLFTLLSDSCITILASLTQSYLVMFILRFLNGFFIGAPSILTYSYYGEFQPENWRNKAICFIGLFFNLVWILLPAIAWFIIPLQWKFELFGLPITSWRLCLILLSIPSFISGIWMIYLPESPKFLLTRGESKEALIILNKMYVLNSGNSTDHFKVKLLVDNINLKKSIEENRKSMKSVGQGKTFRLMKDAKQQIKQLFKPPLLSYTVLISSILFCNMFGYLGLGLWIPEILNRFQEFTKLNPEGSITLCELQSRIDQDNEFPISLSNLTKYIVETEELYRCENHVDVSVYVNTFIMGVCVVVGNIVAIIFAGKFSRKVLPVFTMFISSVTAASIYWLDSTLQHLIAGSLFQASIGVANVVLSGVVVEIFPTAVGAMAICTSILFGRLGAVVSNLVLGFLLDVSCATPLTIIVCILIVGTLLAFFIPSDKVQKETPKEIYKSISDISIISNI